ncbi:MAG: hypothetical protein K8T25_03655 [Planctomycetia bacterium]|nr:hypothetical protein [Planctomycetia bacterium]
MSQATLDPTVDAPMADAPLSTVLHKLHLLRRRIAAWFVIDGVSRLLACLVLLVGFDLAIDWTFSMDRPQRVVMLVLVLIVLGVVAYRRLVRPLGQSLSDDALCLLVERQQGQLQEQLISALQLSRGGGWEQQGVSPTFVAATIQGGAKAAESMPFESVLRRRPLLFSMALALAMGGALLGIAVATVRTETMAIWFQRNVLLTNRPWPQDFYLAFDGAADGTMRIPRGEEWPIVVTAKAARPEIALPEEVTYELRGRHVETRTERFERIDGGKRFIGKMAGPAEAVEIRAFARGASTDWIKVLPVDRPTVETLSLTVTPPKYTGLKPQKLSEGKGPYSLLPGSRLTVQGSANKPLSAAIVLHGTKRQQLVVREGRTFEMEIPYAADGAGIYGIDLTDTENLPQPGSERPGPLSSRVPVRFTLRTLADRPPQIKAQLVGISGMITSHAKLPLKATIDDDFAVSDVRLRYQWRGPAESRQSGQDAVRPKEVASLLGAQQIPLSCELDVAPLNVPVGSDFSVEIEATDNNNVSTPGVGRCPPMLLRVVSDDELRTDLLRREKEQRQELERLLKVQTGLLADTRDLLQRSANQATWPAAAQQSAARVAREQKIVGGSLSAIAQRVGDLLVEASNNRLEDASGALTARLQDHVRKPLTRVADQRVPEVGLRLDEARRLASSAKERNAALAAAADEQAKIESELQDVLKSMIKVEDFQFVLSLLLEIQQSQTEVLSRSEKERQEQIRRILEHGGNTAPEQPALRQP